MFHDRIVSKNCDDLISIAHHNELSLLLGYEMKCIIKDIPNFALDKVLDFDLEEICMYCVVNCIENTYIANYVKIRKQLEDEENTNEREETSQYPPIISYDESGKEEEPYIQPISLIRSSKKRIKPTHDAKQKKKRRRSKGKKASLPNDVAPTTHCDDNSCYTIGAIHTINDENDMFENIFLQLMFVPSLGMLCLMKMIFLASHVLICKVVMMIACLLPMMIILMKVGLEECTL